MYIRIRAIFVIFFTTLLIISFSVLVGIITVRSNINTAQETDLMLISDIADHFISSEIKALKLKASGAAQWLSELEETQWQNALINIESLHQEFIGIAIWSEERELIAATGEVPAPIETLDNKHVQAAFQGKETISGTILLPEGLSTGPVFCVSVPLTEMNNKILVLTLPYTFFVDLVATFAIWNTGHIFIDDAEGILVANPRPVWVERMIDATTMAEMDQENRNIFAIIRQRVENNAQVVRYSISGVPRICVYRPVSGSQEGWSFGTVAPLPESPFRYINRALIVVGIVSLFLSLIAAIIASGFIKKPFKEIAALKEEAEANSKFKSDFLANMSHEIRTPMNVILGVTEILMRGDTNPQNIHEGLDKIYTSGDLLLNIINDILDLSKIEAGKLELSPSVYEVASLVNDTVTLSMMRIGSKEIDFILSVDENLPQALLGDEVRIKQILNNLLSNAFKYTEKGVVKLSFTIERDNKEKENEFILVFSVSDTGQGMTAEQVNALFDQYSRFNLAANRTIEGTGLGMNITQKLVALMNGEITVQSETSKGSIFTVRLPQECSIPDKLGKDLAESLQDFSLNGARQLSKAQIVYEPMPYGSILIVDDMESNLYVAKGLMMPWELSIDTAISGFRAIDKIKKGNVYDILFMDHMMPKMDGVEATKIIRELGYTHPIVALTANAVKGQQEMFLANGFDDFLSKPVDIRRLNAVLKKYIRDKQPPQVIEAARRHTGDSDEKHQAFTKPQLAEFLKA